MMNGGILGYPILRHSENPGSLGPTYPGTDPQPLRIGQKKMSEIPVLTESNRIPQIWMIPRNVSTFWNLALIISSLAIGQQDGSPQMDESPKLMVSDPLKLMISPF